MGEHNKLYSSSWNNYTNFKRCYDDDCLGICGGDAQEYEFYQDQDGDGMWAGWEYFFDFDPFDPADANIDSDGDGSLNKCENKWNTNPKDPVSFPSQGELCNQFE